MKIAVKNYYAGTSGLILPVPNKLYYPAEFIDQSRLCYYASLMNSVEINSSFYKIPLAKTVKRWAEEVPANFKFTFKLAKDITHAKNLAFDPKLIEKFINVISNVGEKKGCLLVQLPPSIRIGQLYQVYHLIHLLRANDLNSDWKIALEFRHQSLYTNEILDFLNSMNIGIVKQDKIGSPSFTNENTPNFVYFRFHGPDGNYRNSYSDDALLAYGEQIAELLQQEKQVYVYFNNTMGSAFQNLQQLNANVNNMYLEF